MAQKFFDLVKTAIFYQFLKLRFFHARPSEAESGTSDVNPGYWNRSEVVIIGEDRRSGWLAKNFRRISMTNLLGELKYYMLLHVCM